MKSKLELLKNSLEALKNLCDSILKDDEIPKYNSIYHKFIKTYGIHKDNRLLKSDVDNLLIAYSEFLWINKQLPIDITECIKEFTKEEK